MWSNAACTPVLRRALIGAVLAPLLVVMVGTSAQRAQAAAWRDIDGSFAITGADMLNPPEGAPEDTHLRLQLRGIAARDLYQALPAQAVTDPCTGEQMKQAGQLRCVYFAGRRNYQCDFAVALASQRIEVGIPC